MYLLDVSYIFSHSAFFILFVTLNPNNESISTVSNLLNTRGQPLCLGETLCILNPKSVFICVDTVVNEV